ncbi:Rv3654c family TadE-like protein [Raineyella sp. LH-20]|uniref:Rv3654c family TadE-like protein n=1 Tax=Raineyella sp. LH-20 TaxID=3081204 RepID=UPI0029544929|nr:Rv3654c family TadE-like protein [Raineyella sp. LH-20]WOP19068.1 hypothetical protein R0146_01995 [Raineyella sp. LH-20]
MRAAAGRPAGGPRRRRTDQRGSGTALLASTVAILLVLAWAGLIGGTYALGMHRVRGIADRAALAGAAAYVTGADPCPAVRRQVEAEPPATLTGCRAVGDMYRYVVSVQVVRPVAIHLPGLPAEVGAVAHAGPGEAGRATVPGRMP